MTLNLSLPQRDELKPRITVFGVGGAGGNAVNNMIEKQLDGVEFVVANTDAQALSQSKAATKVQMGVKVTEGLGAGARAAVGAAAAEESIEEIVDHLAGAHMCFITAGMGGGTGSGATPIIAQAARELGVLTVGVVTKPFQFEGNKRMAQAEEAIEALQKMVDTLIIIPNQNLFRLANENTTCTDAFGMADDVLYQGVKGVTDLMVRPGMINLDFADVRSVMDEMGKAMMGTGEAEGEDRALKAAELAIANPLLDEISLNGAKGVLINVIGGYDMTLFELDEAANVIRDKVDPDANIIVGSTLDDSMEGRMRVSVVATGIDVIEKPAETPVPRRRLAEPLHAGRTDSAPAETPAPRPAVVAAAEPEMDEPEMAAADDEPDFFASFKTTNRDAPDGDALFGAPEDDADVPPPAYSGEPVRRTAKPGEPSPEALARLEKAVRRAPGAPQPGPSTAPRLGAPQPSMSGAAAERPRFGINSLIGRMTGQPDADRQQASAPQTARRPQPQPQRAELSDEAQGDQDRIEIPAFLRRQAN
ncbi:cell division protein FtsZ [Maribius pontilimi]|uniref:Cell division protein FtsZ n=1 Tax=Palleronia pontilimi TaxID=1964209 RepID=A0A934IF10_9RHOB|nr:cell division protein FtsZ [Palleronia pontilimi]MBJ3762250.1 cell division protein FtsZ [Palleronia pontilimi]